MKEILFPRDPIEFGEVGKPQRLLHEMRDRNVALQPLMFCTA